VSSALSHAAGQAWPPFVLVIGLLLIGAVVHDDGLFESIGVRAARIGGGPIALLASLLTLEAIVVAVLNLDTAAVFVTPILLHAARERGCDERPFLYGALFMTNCASLLLPGSNLTNLIVLAHEPLTGADIAKAMVLPWIVAVTLTIAFVAIVFRPREGHRSIEAPPPVHIGLGAAATGAATGFMLALHNPAVPVLVVGLLAAAVRRLRPKLGAPVLAALFLFAVVLGTLARRWNGPTSLVVHAGGIGAAAIGAVSSVLLNNLPAASLLSAKRPPHPLPLLIGLNLGPNLVFTGSLSAYLWYQAARTAGTRPSLRLSSVLGIVLVPLTIAGALAALALVKPSAF
jgi:arsenical pump membrane protein